MREAPYPRNASRGDSFYKKRRECASGSFVNSLEATANTLLKVLIEANSQKVEKVIQEAAEQVHNNKESDEGHSA